MSHNLSFNNGGKAEMAYVGRTPWHRYGTKVREGATSEEMIVASGIDYPLSKRMLQTEGGIHVPSAAIFRDDTEKYLGTVGADYHIIPNRELFKSVDPFIQDGTLQWETCGVLFDGRIVWVLAKIPQNITVRNDSVEGYVLLSNGHDGWHSLRVDLTPIRVVCWNTLSFSTGMTERGDGSKSAQGMVKHTKNWKQNLDKVIEDLNFAKTSLVSLGDVFESFAQKTITESMAEVMYEALVPDNPDAKRNTRTVNKREDLMWLFKHGAGNRGESLWDWYNGATEYADGNHEGRALGIQGVEENRLKSIYQGAGKKMKVTAYNMALAEVS